MCQVILLVAERLLGRTRTSKKGVTDGSSFRICASSYVKADFEAITDLVNLTLMMFASGDNSYGILSAKRLYRKEVPYPDYGEGETFNMRSQ